MILPKGFHPTLATAVLKGEWLFLRLENDTRSTSVSSRGEDKGPKRLLKLRNWIYDQAPGLTIVLRIQSEAGGMRCRPIDCKRLVINVYARTECRIEGKANAIVVNVRSFQSLYSFGNAGFLGRCLDGSLRLFSNREGLKFESTGGYRQDKQEKQYDQTSHFRISL